MNDLFQLATEYARQSNDRPDETLAIVTALEGLATECQRAVRALDNLRTAYERSQQ